MFRRTRKHFELSYIFTFWVPWCDICCDFRIKPMFGSSVHHVLFYIFVFVCVLWCPTIWEKWRMSYKRHELLAIRRRLGLPPVFGGVRFAHLFSFLCCVILVWLRPMPCVPNVASVTGLSILDCPFGVP